MRGLSLVLTLFSIPLVAVIYSLVREDTNRRLQKREVKDFES